MSGKASRKMRTVIPQALNLIARTEKLSLKAYQGKADADDVWTIGYGHVIRASEFQFREGITAEKAGQLFAADVASHSKFIQEDVGIKVTLDDWIYGALASLCYNVGPRTLLGAPSIVNKLREGKINEGVLNMYKFSISDKQYRDGLFYRRLTEMVLALRHKLVVKPYECNGARELIKQLAAFGSVKDMEAYFAKNHRKDLCASCQASHSKH